MSLRGLIRNYRTGGHKPPSVRYANPFRTEVEERELRLLRPILDECYDAEGKPYLRGRCDTCGAPCDDTTGDCTKDASHETALE